MDGGVPKLHWKAPADWKEQPAGNVRIASFSITTPEGGKADMSVTQFPGDVGGALANVNRWRGQLGLPAVTEEDLPKLVKTTTAPAGEFSVTEFGNDNKLIEGSKHDAMIGAWLKQPERTWFFKLSGDAEIVSAQRDAFMAFLQSVEFAAPDVASDPASLLDGAAAAAENGAAPLAGGPAAANRTVTWTAPTEWTPKPLGQMRKGSFALHGVDAAEADFSIISFPGEAGGIAENLNRWRKQIDLPPLAPTDLAGASSTVAHDGLRFTVVNYLGTTANGPTRLLGAILPLENETYFFKILGPDAVVSQHKDAFIGFLKTVKVR